MPRRRTPAQDAVIQRVLDSDKQMKEAHKTYKEAQDSHLSALREARNEG